MMNMSCSSTARGGQFVYEVDISEVFDLSISAKEETHRCQSHASFKSLSFKAWDLKVIAKRSDEKFVGR